MTRLTFGQALTLFARYVTNTGAGDPIIAQALNFVLEKFQKSPTHYKGSQQVIPLQSKNGIIALPQGYEAIDGLKTLTDEEFVILQSQQFAFNESTSNFKSDDVAIRLGGGFATQYDPQIPEIVTFTTTDSPPPATALFVKALDANNNPIYTNGQEGFEIDFSTTSPTICNGVIGHCQWNPQPLSSIYQIIKPTTTNPITLTTPHAGQIGLLSPLDQIPEFQRYSIAGHDRAFAALVTRAFRIISEPNDLVYPANINALRYGMQAWQYEDIDDLLRANTYWQMAFKALDEELETFQSNATQSNLNVQLRAFAPRIRNLI